MAASVLFRSSSAFDAETTAARTSQIAQRRVFDAETAQADSTAEQITIDLIENLAVAFDESGVIRTCEVVGNLHVKSCLSAPANLLITFGSSESSPQQQQRANPTLEAAHLDTSVELRAASPSGKGGRNQLAARARPGTLLALTYHSAKRPQALPFTLYAITTASSPCRRSVTVQLKIHCAVPRSHRVVKFRGLLPLPSNTVNCEGRSSVFSMQFRKVEGAFEFTCPQYPSDSHHTVTVQLLLERLTPATRVELSRVVFQFEVPSFSVENVRMTAVSVQKDGGGGGGGEQEASFEKWTRQLMHSNAYEFALDTSGLVSV